MLVALNSLFQIVAYSLLGYFYLTLLPGWLGLDTQGFEVSIWEVARTVLIFLGIPLLAGYLTRRVGVKRRGRDWYENTFIPGSPAHALRPPVHDRVAVRDPGRRDHRQPLDVARIALPLLVYFLVMFGVSFAVGRQIGFAVRRRRRSPSPPRATTSSSRSRSRSASSAPPPARRSPASSAR